MTSQESTGRRIFLHNQCVFFLQPNLSTLKLSQIALYYVGQIRLDKKHIGYVEQSFYFLVIPFISKKNGFKARYGCLGIFCVSLQPLFTCVG